MKRNKGNPKIDKSNRIEDVLDEMFNEDDVDTLDEDGYREDDYGERDNSKSTDYHVDEHPNHLDDEHPDHLDDEHYYGDVHNSDEEEFSDNYDNPSRSSRSRNNISFSMNLVVKVLSSFALIVSLLFVFMYTNKVELFTKGHVGVKAVKLLYDFGNIKQLENNLEDLEDLMTERCYYKTTVLNSDKSLNTYLKFKQSDTRVNIIDSKPGFVLYSLVNKNISENRIFIFSYRLNLFGKIYEVREFEAIDFYSEVQSVSDEELDKLIEEWSNE